MCGKILNSMACSELMYPLCTGWQYLFTFLGDFVNFPILCKLCKDNLSQFSSGLLPLVLPAHENRILNVKNINRYLVSSRNYHTYSKQMKDAKTSG